MTHDQSVGSARSVQETLQRLLATDLTFRETRAPAGIHGLHAFPARFPPPLPRLFIEHLTAPGDWVLDPMAGSGTTLVEAVLTGRGAIGVDLDPLAVLIAQAKTRPPDPDRVATAGAAVLDQAQGLVHPPTESELAHCYGAAAVRFFRYWFEEPVIAELHALALAIRQAPADLHAFLQTLFSSLIITKSGGLSRARDLAHSRPHRDPHKRVQQSALAAFAERLEAAQRVLAGWPRPASPALIVRADARALPLADRSVALIVTSPPYAAGAIDYLRAHKFSLVWLGYPPDRLTPLRRRYIGSEQGENLTERLPPTARAVLRRLTERDPHRAAVVARYYRDLGLILAEMLRVLQPGRAAVIVVGSSIIRGIPIQVPAVLRELAEQAGFRFVGQAVREIVRDARMLPVSARSHRQGIEARLHEETVVGLVRPEA